MLAPNPETAMMLAHTKISVFDAGDEYAGSGCSPAADHDAVELREPPVAQTREVS